MMTIQSSGDFEIFCHPSGSNSRGSVPFFDKITVGDKLSLVFVPEESAAPPFTLKIFSPAGTTVLEKIIREAPTGAPQSPPPLEFVVSARGVYRVEIRSLYGKQRAEATIQVD